MFDSMETKKWAMDSASNTAPFGHETFSLEQNINEKTHKLEGN
jgi:hypothetical protein